MEKQVLISGLTPGTVYTIQIEAVTEDMRITEVGEIQVTTETGSYQVVGKQVAYRYILHAMDH